MDSEPILKKTLVTVGAMVGACVAFVGTVSLVAVFVTSHVVGASGGTGGGASATSGTAVTGPRAPHSDTLPTTPSHTTARSHETTHDTI